MEPLATTEELAERVPFVMDEDELREAERAIEDLSDEARHYGSSAWETSTVTPRQVCRLVIKAAARHMKNYEGFVTSRAGDETVTWSDRREEMGDAVFNREERRRLAELGGSRRTLHTVGVFGYQTRSRAHRPVEGLVPVDDGSASFPYFSDPVDPW